ncbi:MAG: cell division protein FtsZ [Candidatus Marsarchaeota archaeon]|jgi:cell division protein FtsZ|nr:cell division protein FtsZ [Candidatus Marsarchaeota archaeon]
MKRQVDEMPETTPAVQEALSVDDEELLKFIESAKPKIYVVGAGGSGSNTATRMSELNIEGATLIAMNTDAPHLAKTRATRKVLLGKKSTRGLGAGSDPKLGEDAAVESKEDIRHLLSDAQLVFLTCGLGGGTGTGSIPIIAHEAKELGALTVAIVTLPFTSEGKVRMRNALEGLAKLKRFTDTTIIIPNDKLLSVAPDLPLNMAFRISDEILAKATKGIIEMVTKPGMVNLDFADLRSVLKDSGYAVIGIGEANATQTTDRSVVAIENTLKSPLLDVNLSTAKKALVNIIGGDDLTLREAENIFQEVSGRISEDAMMKWGARIDTSLQKNVLRIMVVLSGVEFAEYTETGLKKKIVEATDLNLDEIFGEEKQAD